MKSKLKTLSEFDQAPASIKKKFMKRVVKEANKLQRDLMATKEICKR
jgi:hypothetical protein